MSKTLADTLADAIGATKVATDEASRRARRFDYWAVKHLRDWLEQPVDLPGIVVRPETVADVQAVMRIASAHGIPVVPYGLGSGVCGGIEPGTDTIVVDMGAMNNILSIDAENGLATFEAGKNGLEAEVAVAEHGMTIGHWPQSIAISSVGGWVATRASGQFSTAYGNIEDVVHSIDAVLPDGSFVTLGKAPRAAAGPDLRHLLMGAEGTMGIITAVTFALRDKPAARAFSTWYVDDMDQGFAVQRAIIKADWRPPVMRQYDESEVKRLFAGHDRDGKAMLLLVHEGPQSRVDAELVAVAAIAQATGAVAGAPEAGREWIERRNHVPGWSAVFERNMVADTIEISGKWTEIADIYHDAVASLREVPGILNASAHSSHVYRSGINLYFSFAIHRDDMTELEAAYFEAWRRVIEATVKNGGGIAHHHGTGRVRAKYIVNDLGENGVALLRKVMKAVDPQGLMNPGNLVADA